MEWWEDDTPIVDVDMGMWSYRIRIDEVPQDHKRFVMQDTSAWEKEQQKEYE